MGLSEMILKLKPPTVLLAHKGTISKWQINVAALKLAERQRKRKEGTDEAKKPDERVEEGRAFEISNG